MSRLVKEYSRKWEFFTVNVSYMQMNKTVKKITTNNISNVQMTNNISNVQTTNEQNTVIFY